MRGNEHFWLGVTLSDDPAPDNLFVVASYAIDPDGKIGSTASRVVDPAVREDLAGALRAIADGSEAPTAPHGWLTLEGFADEPGSDVDLAFDTVGYGTVVNVEHADAGEDVHAAIRSACALLAGAFTGLGPNRLRRMGGAYEGVVDQMRHFPAPFRPTRSCAPAETHANPPWTY